MKTEKSIRELLITIYENYETSLSEQKNRLITGLEEDQQLNARVEAYLPQIGLLRWVLGLEKK